MKLLIVRCWLGRIAAFVCFPVALLCWCATSLAWGNSAVLITYENDSNSILNLRPNLSIYSIVEYHDNLFWTLAPSPLLSWTYWLHKNSKETNHLSLEGGAAMKEMNYGCLYNFLPRQATVGSSPDSQGIKHYLFGVLCSQAMLSFIVRSINRNGFFARACQWAYKWVYRYGLSPRRIWSLWEMYLRLVKVIERRLLWHLANCWPIKGYNI
jgi:hypothetical protein